MTPWHQLLLVWAFAVVLQGLAWARQQHTRNAGIVDVAWSFGVGAAATVEVSPASPQAAAAARLSASPE